MSNLSYFLGVLFAIFAGFIVNIGVLLQKKVINKNINEPKFMVSLVKNPLWILGILLQIVIGGLIFYLIAIILIGPALVPGLMASGLIILAFGSVKLLNEKVEKEEIIGTGLMIIGIFLLGLSQLTIDVSSFNVLDNSFLTRIVVFTIIFILIAIILEILNRKNEKCKGVLMAFEAGIILSLNTVWASPGTTVLMHIIGGKIIIEEIYLAIIVVILLLVIMTIGVIKGQISLKYGQANLLAPITSVPIQIIPIIAYFFVFLAIPPNNFSIVYMIIGFLLIISSSFLLSKRQGELEALQ